MSKLYAISGVTGMTGNELVRQILVDGSIDHILGFDNFYASSIETVSDRINDERFEFFEYDLNNKEQMADFERRIVGIKENYDDGKFSGASRAGVTISVVDGEHDSKCLAVTGASETWDGYTIDVSRFIGKKIKYSFAVKSTADVLAFTADISDLWPRIEEVDTSSHDWVIVEGELDMTGAKWTTKVGEYDVPELTTLRLYWETADVTDDFYLDDVVIELAA